MRLSLSDLLCLSLIAADFAVPGLFYAELPDLTPTHWGWSGQADGFTPKPLGPFLLPLIAFAVQLVLWVAPRLSPRGYRLEGFLTAYQTVMLALQALLFGLILATVLLGLGFQVSVEQVGICGLGLLFLIIGNLLGKTRKNFVFGVRTPWTLASDEVWLRTHRLAGWLMVLAGFVIVIGGLCGWGRVILLPVILTAALISWVYSYLIYRKLRDAGG